MLSALSSLKILPCAGAVPGKVFMAPSATVIAIAYNGIWLRANTLYSQTGGIITLNFSAEQGDAIYALCIA